MKAIKSGISTVYILSVLLPFSGLMCLAGTAMLKRFRKPQVLHSSKRFEYTCLVFDDQSYTPDIKCEEWRLSDIIRDFKKFTSGTIVKQIENNAEESRKGWMLWIFKQAGANNSKNNQYQFWQQDNQPIQLETNDFTLTKLNYIHQNPVKAGIVTKAEDYLLSSAKDYNGEKGLVPIDHLTAAYTIRK